MKIALCKSHFFGPVSGADEILVSYAISLHNAGHDVDVVLFYKPSENDRYNRRLRKAVEQFDLSNADDKILRMIHGAAFHDIYHAGQIQLLKRL